MSASPPLDPWIGRSIGDRQRYFVKEFIGGGGMGEVFLATDRLLGQPVALKILSSKLATADMRKRFEREVAVSAALRSDHIVQVFDYGITPEGYPFYVMEYLSGQTLGQLLKQEPCLPVERTLRIMAQICSGLALAHQGIDLQWQGSTTSETVKVIHRDLKPDNIFLVPTALGEFVKLLDFGIAKIRSEQHEQTHLTQMFMGTYQYASPEQLRTAKDLDERADIYSLGMILYRMLSGSSPFSFTAEGAGAQPSGAMWAVAHLTQSPLPLRQQPGCEHLPPALEAVVMRCLEKSPDRRFSSVLELNQALHAAVNLADRPFRATHSSPIPSDVKHAPRLHLSQVEPTTFLNSQTTASPVDVTALTANWGSTQPMVQQPSRQPSQPLRRLRQPTPLLIGTGIAIVAALGISLYTLQSSVLLTGQAEEATPSEDPTASDSARPTDRPAEQSAPASTSAATQSLVGHSETVWAVAVSPDGNSVVSGGFDKTIRSWNLQTGALQRTLVGHTDAIRSIAISPDGTTLVSGSGDKTIKIWNLQTGALQRTLSGHIGPVWSVALSPDGQTLASGSYDGAIKLWDVQTGQLLQTLPEHYDSIWSVAFSPDGNTLASGSYDKTIKLWDVQTGQLLRTLSGHSDSVRSVAFSPDGNTLVSGSWDKTVNVWDLRSGSVRHTLSGHTDRVLSVAMSADGQTLASSSIDRTIKIWDTQTGELLQTLSGHSDWVIAIAFHPQDQHTLVSASKDKTVKVWQW